MSQESWRRCLCASKVHQINWQVFEEGWSDGRGPTREHGKYTILYLILPAPLPTAVLV